MFTKTGRGLEVERASWSGDRLVGETPHLALEGAEALQGVVEGCALLRRDAAGVGGDAIAEEEDDEGSEFAENKQDKAEWEEFEEVVLGAEVEDVLAS